MRLINCCFGCNVYYDLNMKNLCYQLEKKTIYNSAFIHYTCTLVSLISLLPGISSPVRKNLTVLKFYCPE